MKPRLPSAPSIVEGNLPRTALLPSPWAQAIHKPVFIVFLAIFALEWVRLLLGMADDQVWTLLLFWALAAATSLVGLARRLTGQNVLASATLITLLSFGIELISDRTGIPFGPRVYTDAAGPKVLAVPLVIPLLWLTVIVSTRGVARLILRPWRKTTYYGFWVIGLACLLAVGLDVGLEPFASRVTRCWFWHTLPNVRNWYSAPWAHFLGWGVTTLGILGFTTPWLINKQPVKEPTDYHPLAIWLLLNLCFATGNAANRMWLALGATAVGCVVATVYAIRGARW